MPQTLELSAQKPNPCRYDFSLMASFVFLTAASLGRDIGEVGAFEELAIKREGEL